MADARDTGARVLQELDRGRAIAIEHQRERSQANDLAVRRALDLDLMSSASKYGRVKRISKMTGIKECTVRKSLIRLSSCIESEECNAAGIQPETA